RRKAESGEQAGAANVPRVGDDEAPGLVEPAKHLDRALHFRVSLRASTLAGAAQTDAKSTDLCQVPAVLHVAPLAAPVSAGILEQPTAFLTSALSQTRQVPRGQKHTRRMRNRPKHPIQRNPAANPLPG